MKKSLLFIMLGIITTFSYICTSINKVNALEGGSYSISSFSSLPSDWKLSNKCDVSNSSYSISNNEIVLSHTSESDPGSSLYYGSLYFIDIENYWSDFSFEITIKMTNQVNSSRWFGICYHTNVIDDNMVGYGMNYRYNGNSAFTAINGSQSFNDGDKINSQNVLLSDGKYHTLKVTMSGTSVTHYIDGIKIISWDINDRKDHLGGENILSGGFGIIVNRSTINVKKINITGNRVSAPKSDDSLVSTYNNTSLVNFPTVICDIKNEDKLNEIGSSTVKPSNAILHIDDEMNVVDDNDGIIDSFTNVFNNILKKQIIPVIYLRNEDEADAFIIYLSEVNKILDMAIMSNNPSLIKKVKETHYYLRGIIEFDEVESLYDVVKITNSNYGLVAVLNQKIATQSNVSYVQARFKTVWINVEDESGISIYSSINSGAYGLIVNDYKNVYDCYETYDETSLTRTPYNVAHRGLPSNYNENSVKGVETAIKMGATHLELDCYLTTDNEIVMMHDKTIDRTSNGSGNVESFSLNEIQQYTLDLHEPNEHIPSFDEIVLPIIKNDVVLVLEIKSSNVNIVNVLKEKLIKYDLFDKIVVISFDTSILNKMKEELAEVPTANLNTATISGFSSALYEMGKYNSVIDTKYKNTSKDDNMLYYRDRGIIGWYWTFNTEEVLKEGISNGYIGLTNNVADYLSDKIKYIEGIEFVLGKNESIDDHNFKLKATTYSNMSYEIDGSLFAYEDMGEYYLVICSYDTLLTGGSNTLYTQSFKVNKEKEITNSDSKDNDIDSDDKISTTNIVLLVINSILLIGLLSFMFVLLKKAKK